MTGIGFIPVYYEIINFKLLFFINIAEILSLLLIKSYYYLIRIEADFYFFYVLIFLRL
jgi:hypothetical protein